MLERLPIRPINMATMAAQNRFCPRSPLSPVCFPGGAPPPPAVSSAATIFAAYLAAVVNSPPGAIVDLAEAYLAAPMRQLHQWWRGKCLAATQYGVGAFAVEADEESHRWMDADRPALRAAGIRMLKAMRRRLGPATKSARTAEVEQAASTSTQQDHERPGRGRDVRDPAAARGSVESRLCILGSEPAT